MSASNKHAMLLLVVLFMASLDYSPTASAETQSPPAPLPGEDLVSPFKTAVRVYNNLGDGLDVTIHCKSKDDDLGVHVVKVDQFYEWKFRVNFWGTTLFFCGLVWRHGSGVYDIFVAERDQERCSSNCVWRVKRNGVHGYEQRSGGEDLYYRWKNKWLE